MSGFDTPSAGGGTSLADLTTKLDSNWGNLVHASLETKTHVNITGQGAARFNHAGDGSAGSLIYTRITIDGTLVWDLAGTTAIELVVMFNSSLLVQTVEIHTNSDGTCSSAEIDGNYGS